MLLEGGRGEERVLFQGKSNYVVGLVCEMHKEKKFH